VCARERGGVCVCESEMDDDVCLLLEKQKEFLRKLPGGSVV